MIITSNRDTARFASFPEGNLQPDPIHLVALNDGTYVASWIDNNSYPRPLVFAAQPTRMPLQTR